MKHPDLTPLDSSVIKGYAYDPNTRDLHIRFPNGDVHRFADVPADKVEALKGSQSPGSYFNRKIAGLHAGRKV